MANSRRFKHTPLAAATLDALASEVHADNAGIRAPINLRSSATRTIAVAGISAAMLMPFYASAQEATTQDSTLAAIKVEEKAIDPNPNAEVGAPYKARTSADSRHTRPLAETPQTIQVLTKAAIDDSGQTDLAQILGAQPGITLGVGENGNMFGDNYVIRGQAAKSDIFIDGLRDPGMNTRESFAVEQVEITKGPNSSFAGRGSAGGAVNLVTKQATLDYNFTRATVGVGTYNYKRVTTDINQALGDKVAVRLNALWDDEGVPERTPAGRERKGLALSGLYEATKDLSITLDYYASRASNPYYDAGGWLTGTAPNRYPATVTPPHTQNDEFMRSDSNIGTARIEWKITPSLTLDSRTRYGSTNNAYAFTTATYNANAHDGTVATPTGGIVLNDQHQRWQEVKYFAHQDNLRWDTDLGNGKKNELVGTIEYSNHQVDQGVFTQTNTRAFNCRTTAGVGANNAYCISTFGPEPTITVLPNVQATKGNFWTRGRQNYDWNIKTVAASVMDTIDITTRITAFAGVRLDRVLDFTAKTLNTTNGAVTGNYQYTDTLHNYWGGLSFKVTRDSIVYAAVGTGQDINGGEPDSGTAAGYGGLVQVTGSGVNVNAKPETSRNIELGTKWNLLNQKLLATAAVFRTDKWDVMETISAAEFAVSGTSNTGGNRVQGIELGLAGNVTEKLSVVAGITSMKSEITKSDPSLTGGSGPTAIGHRLSNFANQQYVVQAKYQITRAFNFGGVVRHQSYMCGGQPDTAAVYVVGVTDCNQRVPGYTVGDVFATYRINKHFQVRANVTNVANKDYYTGVYRSGNWLTIGDHRRGILSLELDY